MVYENENDHIGWHQHEEDRGHNTPVFIVPVGEERTFGIREKGKPETTIKFTAKSGSGITLPSEYNDTHEHAVLKDKGQKGIRYAWNCKCVDEIYHALNSQAPKVWDCHAGKKYPTDAIYVGCRVRDRKGGVIREGTICGNGDDPLKSHHGWKKTDQEFRQEAVRRMSEGFARLSAEQFRKEVDALRGKHLLCWCKQDGPKRATFCHARVCLELANQREAAQ